MRRWARRDRDAVANGDDVVAYQDLFDQEPHDALALDHIQRFSGSAQAGEKGCQGFGQAQECSPVSGLIGDRLQLRPHRTLTLAEQWHALTQLFDR